MQRHDFFPGARIAPAWTETILRKYGQNRWGENLFRVVWLPSRCYFAGGYWDATDELSYKRTPKYGLTEEKWALERWIPPAAYGTPETWDFQTSTPEGYWSVGPFPEHGEFECCAPFSMGRGLSGYIPLDPDLVDKQARLIWMGRTLTVWDIRSSAFAEEERKEAGYDEDFERAWNEVQFSHKGITIGAGVAYNPRAAIEAYKHKLIHSPRNMGVHKSQFVDGFSQDDNLAEA